MKLRDGISYTRVQGTRPGPALRVFALSTCGFCEKALVWLKEKGYTHDYVFIDLIPVEEKKAIKDELRASFGAISVFPVLTIDDTTMLSGFTEARWVEALGAD